MHKEILLMGYKLIATYPGISSLSYLPRLTPEERQLIHFFVQNQQERTPTKFDFFLKTFRCSSSLTFVINFDLYDAKVKNSINFEVFKIVYVWSKKYVK